MSKKILSRKNICANTYIYKNILQYIDLKPKGVNIRGWSQTHTHRDRRSNFEIGGGGGGGGGRAWILGEYTISY